MLQRALLDKEFENVAFPWEAAQALAKNGSEAAIATLVQALTHEDFNTRSSIASTLSSIVGNEEAISSVIEVAISVLIQALELGDPTPDQRSSVWDEVMSVRGNTFRAIKHSNNPSAIAALHQALHHEDPEVCFFVAVELAKEKDVEAIAVLHQLLEAPILISPYRVSEGLNSIAINLLHAKSENGHRNYASDEEDQELAESFLRQALRCGDSDVRYQVICHLGLIGCNSFHGENAQKNEIAAKRRVIDMLCQVLGDADVDLRLQVIGLLVYWVKSYAT